VVFVLLALWLPATQHCGLEAAGFITSDSSDNPVACCEPTATFCAYDNCHVIEQFTPKTSNDSLQVPTPDFVACACFLCVQILDRKLSAGSVVSVVATDQPVGWVPTWHFARRAAPLPRAPTVLV
jgi:hypothetical protein